MSHFVIQKATRKVAVLEVQGTIQQATRIDNRATGVVNVVRTWRTRDIDGATRKAEKLIAKIERALQKAQGR